MKVSPLTLFHRGGGSEQFTLSWNQRLQKEDCLKMKVKVIVRKVIDGPCASSSLWKLTWSSQTHACILRYESLPFSVSLSQDFGFDSSSDTVPWLKPKTYLVENSLILKLLTIR